MYVSLDHCISVEMYGKITAVSVPEHYVNVLRSVLKHLSLSLSLSL